MSASRRERRSCPRPGTPAAAAIALLTRGGVRVKVLTGDNELVARTICRQVGVDGGGGGRGRLAARVAAGAALRVRAAPLGVVAGARGHDGVLPGADVRGEAGARAPRVDRVTDRPLPCRTGAATASLSRPGRVRDETALLQDPPALLARKLQGAIGDDHACGHRGASYADLVCLCNRPAQAPKPKQRRALPPQTSATSGSIRAARNAGSSGRRPEAMSAPTRSQRMRRKYSCRG
jgi:hypothetical protein